MSRTPVTERVDRALLHMASECVNHSASRLSDKSRSEWMIVNDQIFRDSMVAPPSQYYSFRGNLRPSKICN